MEEPWPLVIIDNTGIEHSVVLQPGEMLFYESARLAHGRPRPFNGSYFASMFVHYTPNGWDLSADTINSHLPEGWDHGTRDELWSQMSSLLCALIVHGLLLMASISEVVQTLEMRIPSTQNEREKKKKLPHKSICRAKYEILICILFTLPQGPLLINKVYFVQVSQHRW